MKKQLQLIMYTVFMVSLGLTCQGQQIGDEFTSNNIRYRVTKLSPNKHVTLIAMVDQAPCHHYMAHAFC